MKELLTIIVILLALSTLAILLDGFAPTLFETLIFSILMYPSIEKLFEKGVK